MTDIEDRFRSALAVRAAEIEPQTAPPGLVRRVRRRRAVRGVLAGAVALMAVVAAVAAVAWWPRIDDRLTSPAVLRESANWRTAVQAMPAGPLTARRDVSGVWTGSELLVWGGRAGSQYFADGAAFNPTTRSWRRLPDAPLSARASQEAVWTGTEMVVWGGVGAKRGPFDLTDGAAYNPGTGVWRKIAPKPGAGRVAGVALYAAGKVIIAGGDSSYDSAAPTKVLLYDPVTGRWSTVQAAMRVHDAAVDGDILVLAELDDSRHLFIQQVDLAAPAAKAPVAVPFSSGVERLGLAIGEETLTVAAADPAGESTKILSGRLSAAGGPASWSTGDTRPGVQPSVQLNTGYRGMTVALSPDALLLAAQPDVSIVNPRTGQVLLQSAYSAEGGPCGISGALVWTGSALLNWGGQTCSPSGARTTAQGEVWTIRRP